MVADFWNNRYNNEDYIYGKEPNIFLREQLQSIPIGRILFPCEGEGRNAVYAAKLGWEVAAFDSSHIGKEKANLLATQNNTAIDYIVSDIENIFFQEESFDALALIYAHFSEDKRKIYHQKVEGYLKKGGLLFLEAFHKTHALHQQKNPQAGGPHKVEMLYNLAEVQADFKNLKWLKAEVQEIVLTEGQGHLGDASVVRLVGIKD